VPDPPRMHSPGWSRPVEADGEAPRLVSRWPINSISARRSSSRLARYSSDSFGKFVCRCISWVISCAIGPCLLKVLTVFIKLFAISFPSKSCLGAVGLYASICLSLEVFASASTFKTTTVSPSPPLRKSSLTRLTPQGLCCAASDYFSAMVFRLARPVSNCLPTMLSILKNIWMTFAM